MACLIKNLAFCCCDILCCQCNKYVFPAPESDYKLKGQIPRDDNTNWKFKSFNSEGRQVPYLEVSTQKSRKQKKCFIYFHGNGEDIGFLGFFLLPIVESLNLTFYAVEYPSYGQYYTLCTAGISNKIKEDALNFYQFVKGEAGRSKEDVFVMGRSIGSGGASFLAGHKPIPLLVLMSPFDTIKKVATDFFGCTGNIVYQHFDNQEELAKFNGRLLVIHGERDQVISIQHAKNLVREYEQRNDYKNKAKVVYPQNMTHNSFSLKEDIIAHMASFLSEMGITK